MGVTENEVTDEQSSDKKSWPTEDDKIVTWVGERKNKAEQKLSDWYESAKKDFAFYECQQWEEADVKKLEDEKRVAVTFNRIAHIVNSICGQEILNRQEVRFLPRRVGEVNAADPMNGAVKWVRETCNAEDEDSDAFRDMVICGMGWTVTRMDYEDNPEGEPRVERRDPLLMRWDPAARRKNVQDKKWVQGDYWMTKEAIEQRWPDVDLEALVNVNAPENGQQPIDATEAWKYNNDAAGLDTFQGQWRVIHHVERFTRPMRRVIDPSTNQIQKVSEEEFQKANKNAKAMGLELQSSRYQGTVYWEAWVVGNTVLESGVAEIQRDFQYQAMTCTRERESGYWFGAVRLMLDPQRYANRMASLLMSILATGAKGGVLFETGAFANPAKAKKDWARWDSAIELTAGGLGKIQPKEPVQLPQGAADFMQFSIASIRDVIGANVEMLGNADREQPGVVEEMRTKAGLTVLAQYFDSIRLYRKRQGLVLAEFVEKFLSDGRLIRVLGENGQQFIPLIRNPETLEYDIVVDESPASRDVKERTWMVLGQLVPVLHEQGILMPAEALDYAPVPESLSLAIKRDIAAKKQQPPQPPPEVMKEQARAQTAMQLEQMRGQVAMQLEESKRQTQQLAEHYRAQTDIQIATMEANLKAATERARDQSQMQLKMVETKLEQHTDLMKAIIAAISKVEAARVTAKSDDGSGFVSEASYPQ